MNLRKLKVLHFNMWSVWNLMEGDLEPSEMFSEYTEIPAIIGKPGRYYDRESKVCWTELPNGKAYKIDPKMFLYELETAHAKERPLTDHERNAIRTLLDYGNGPAPKELAERLYQDDNNRMLRETGRGARLARIQILGKAQGEDGEA